MWGMATTVPRQEDTTGCKAGENLGGSYVQWKRGKNNPWWEGPGKGQVHGEEPKGAGWDPGQRAVPSGRWPRQKQGSELGSRVGAQVPGIHLVTGGPELRTEARQRPRLRMSAEFVLSSGAWSGGALTLRGWTGHIWWLQGASSESLKGHSAVSSKLQISIR